MTEARNDIAEDRLELLRSISPTQDLLDEIVALSRAEFGWYTKQFLRGLEYPWIVENVADELPGWRILDVGAGVSPIPLLLARRGAEVVTIDYSDLVRDPAERSTWNEWGFLDYSFVEPGMTSFNMDVLEFEPEIEFDCVYSISVIEHMPADVRRGFIARAAEWTRRGGRLLLTVDIEPSSNRLWNRDRGQVVEDSAAHGELIDLEREVAAFFDIERVELLRRLSMKAGDAAFIRARRR